MRTITLLVLLMPSVIVSVVLAGSTATAGPTDIELAPVVSADEFEMSEGELSDLDLDLDLDENDLTIQACPQCDACVGCMCSLSQVANTAPDSDAFPTVQLTGFFQVDATWFNPDDQSLVTTTSSRAHSVGIGEGFGEHAWQHVERPLRTSTI